MTTTASTSQRTTDTGLYVETWGDGEPVVLVHGSLAVGDEEWDAQRPLAEQGFRLNVFDRRGYGRSESTTGEDYLVDADDICELMGGGAHLVGHSYGGLGVLFAAARRPEATRSLTLLEPAVASLPVSEPAWQALVDEVRDLWRTDLPDDEWVVRFLRAVGSDPDQFPPEMLASAVPLVPVFRNGRPFAEAVPPLDVVAAAAYPKLVVAGGHHDGFDAMCRALAIRLDADLAVIEGAGHEIQFTGDPINQALAAIWRS